MAYKRKSSKVASAKTSRTASKSTVRRQKVKILTEGTSEAEYLTKRILVRAVTQGIKAAAAKTMTTQGFNIVAEDGWVVKVHADGKKEQIKKMAKVKRAKKIVLN